MSKEEEDVRNAPLLVTIFDPQDLIFKDRKYWGVVDLPHPSTGEEINFGMVTSTTGEKHIYEMQSISAKYGSYFIGSWVLKNGDLHVATRVDPLWFVLEQLSSQPKQQWKLYSQLNIHEQLQTILDSNRKKSRRQMENLCRVNMKLGSDEDMLLYKLEEERVLRWLVEKQKRSHKLLTDQAIKSRENVPKISSKSQILNLLEDDDDEATKHPSTPTNPSTTNATNGHHLTALEKKRIQQHSIQVVCEYLSPSWRKKFLQHVGEDEETCLQSTKEAGKKDDMKRPIDEGISEIVGIQSAPKKQKSTPQSAGQKKLQKLSTKGMKSISSFFGVGPKKK